MSKAYLYNKLSISSILPITASHALFELFHLIKKAHNYGAKLLQQAQSCYKLMQNSYLCS